MQCDACGREWWGATKFDVLRDGWKFHLGRGGARFVMCGGCTVWYALVWSFRGSA